jgi:hypothetical protein
MTSKNEHTGDSQKTKPPGDEYRNNYERIFGKKETPKPKEEKKSER